METQGVTLDEIYDVIAFRVILDGAPEHVYAALGIVHAIWRPVPGRFKDYVALPKPNGYQSLHTTVIGPYGERMEVQIRTREMHRDAEFGIAAHWKYKEGRLDPHAAADADKFAWLRQLLEWHQELADPHEFIDPVKVDLFPDEVFVFTPKGEVINLSEGRHADRFRLRDPHAGRRALLGREGERQAGAAAPSARRRRHRRDHDQPGAVSAQGLARVRGLGARAQQDPPRAPRRARRSAAASSAARSSTASSARRASRCRACSRAAASTRSRSPRPRGRSTSCSRWWATASSPPPTWCDSCAARRAPPPEPEAPRRRGLFRRRAAGAALRASA